MTEVRWIVKFSINSEPHTVDIDAESKEDAHAIFQQWLFGPEGEMEDLPGPEWRALQVSGGRKVFRNDWVASFEVLDRHFMITG